MPKRGQAQAISETDRLRYKAAVDRLTAAKEATLKTIGVRVGLSAGQLSKILNGKSKQSSRKWMLDRVLGPSPEQSATARKIMSVVVELDERHQELILERARTFLDEQKRRN